MPRIRTSRTRPPPDGFEDIEPILEEYETKMRDAENESQDGKRKAEGVWGIMRITHIRSRYIYDLYYKREAISRELYDWLLEQGYADAALIAKWKRTGYEKLCCVRCIQARVVVAAVHLIKQFTLTNFCRKIVDAENCDQFMDFILRAQQLLFRS
ncbi:hypothetical protein MGL_0272 [Malassezia globosa CBS 7966]|uniref:Uncharacterized protein n=1 Tax=Malassezia globosa (strain ATCC MYA-4612 / CBS 7966) TaxID=425265 RepID=A8PSK2_MALGO|nr:uncharacterized protein MGL_0272 [Malassezia globosa CBS 7966]EDP45283.1 hypothetical protein MGL_0272 [Malassezia globosa CBS 7966]